MSADSARDHEVMNHPPHFQKNGFPEHCEHSSHSSIGMLVEDPSPIVLELVENSVDIKIISMDLLDTNDIMRKR